MFKIRKIFSNFRNTSNYIFFSITLFFFGVSIITNSIINTLSFSNNFNNHEITGLNIHQESSISNKDLSNQTIVKLVSRFNIREDLSIKGISKKVIPDRYNDNINQTTNQPIIFNDLETTSLQNSVESKKEKFISSILPLIAYENKKILDDRKRLLEIKNLLVLNKTLQKNNQQFLETLASKYKISTVNTHKIDTINFLLELVDEIPNSIVLAQAANESGWGTSRFAKEYNALFGEYTFDINNGVVPIYRDSGEKFLIKFFPSINASIGSYFINLNTHSAYKVFREARKKQRENNLELYPMDLIKHLEPYAKDENYVKIIESIINRNNLTKFDNIKIVTTKL